MKTIGNHNQKFSCLKKSAFHRTQNILLSTSEQTECNCSVWSFRSTLFFCDGVSVRIVKIQDLGIKTLLYNYFWKRQR